MLFTGNEVRMQKTVPEVLTLKYNENSFHAVNKFQPRYTTLNS